MRAAAWVGGWVWGLWRCLCWRRQASIEQRAAPFACLVLLFAYQSHPTPSFLSPHPPLPPCFPLCSPVLCSRGYGTVRYATPEEAAAAIEQFNGTDLEGRTLSVRLDKYA